VIAAGSEPELQRQPDAASAIRAGVQLGEPAAGGLIKIGAKLVRHSQYVTFQMAEMALPRELFAAILERVLRFGAPPLLRRG